MSCAPACDVNMSHEMVGGHLALLKASRAYLVSLHRAQGCLGLATSAPTIFFSFLLSVLFAVCDSYARALKWNFVLYILMQWKNTASKYIYIWLIFIYFMVS